MKHKACEPIYYYCVNIKQVAIRIFSTKQISPNCLYPSEMNGDGGDPLRFRVVESVDEI